MIISSVRILYVIHGTAIKQGDSGSAAAGSLVMPLYTGVDPVTL